MTLRADTVVIGAGVTGLVAAHRLRARGGSVLVFDASDRPGGFVRSEQIDGFHLDLGPFSVMIRSREFVDLVDELGLTPVRAQSGAARYIQHRGTLHEVPSSPRGLLSTRLLSPRGKVALASRMIRSAPAPDGDATTLHDLAVRRGGRETAERIVAPASVGIFAAEADELGAHACMHRVAEADRTARSTIGLVRTLRAGGERAGSRSMITFDGGLEALTDALASRLRDSLRLGSGVNAIERDPDGYTLRTDTDDVSCRKVVLCTGARATAHLIRPHAPGASSELEAVRHADLAVVHLAFRRERVRHSLNGFGYLVPRSEPQTAPVLGVIWPASVFADHAPTGTVVMRAVVGGTRWPDALDRSDQALEDATLAAMRPALGIQGEPLFRHTARWPASVPVYAPDHGSRVERILRDPALPEGLHLAGAWLCAPAGGLGINDRVRDGERIARIAMTSTNSRARATHATARAAPC
ncbi:MAG: protoporphyrinogen oxidase [Planctomycetota bacterium]